MSASITGMAAAILPCDCSARYCHNSARSGISFNTSPSLVQR
jgi:hypothetical protein